MRLPRFAFSKPRNDKYENTKTNTEGLGNEWVRLFHWIKPYLSQFAMTKRTYFLHIEK